ncbi:MAG: TRAP transporter large permease subunit [Myxococcota bacterium]
MKSSPGLFDRIVTVATFLLLSVALVVGLGANVSSVAVDLGGRLWDGYAADLRADPTEPDCELEALDAQLEQCPSGGATPAPPPVPTDEGDPFADEGDPFADPAPAPAPAAPEPDPFADTPKPAPTVNCAALANLRDRCAENWARHRDISGRITPSVRTFRTVELAVSELGKFAYHKHLLVLLVLLGGLQTTRHRAHIALQTPENLVEHQVSQVLQLLAHTVWLVSCFFDWRVQQGSAEVDNPALPVIWGVGLAVLAGVNVLHVFRPPDFEEATPTSPARVLMAIPLYAWMALLGAVWFQAVELNPSGQAIFLHKFVQVPSIYVGIGLYIWAGMLLSQTRLARLAFAVLVPWKLPPNLLAWLVVVLAALPTAYSGASGIFVIAAGSVIFESLREYGARPRIALAATAMSGSLGVVLRPCLVVVLVAVLNKEVTTDALFGWGRWVFALTAGLFLVAMLVRNDQKLAVPPVGEAIAGSGRALLPLLPYAGIGLAVLLGYAWVLGTPVTEHTAAFVLPGVMLALTLWDRRAAASASEGPVASTWTALTEATGESAHHIGALLFVMAGSVGVGGVVERSEAMSILPDDLGSPFTAMVFLVVVMVLVGMTMDALGAVILVSVTLKHVALANGIDPVHFWMMVLCAFELGYLTPPVALNHLLARQVIGEAADMDAVPATSWFHRHEHVVLPMIVMGTALLLVAFVPLLVG